MLTSFSSTRAVAATAAMGLGLIAAFQVALALGAPWGRAAWGGAQATLSPELRTASAVSAVVWALAVLVVLARGGFWGSLRWGATVRWLTWALAGLLGLGAIVNFASSSPWERFGWGPFALVMAILCSVLARARTTPAAPASA